VLKVEIGESGPVVCREAYRQNWQVAAYAAHYGELRGGAPPVRIGDQYVSFFHSVFPVRLLRRCLFRLLRKRPDKVIRYVGGVYGFAAEPPFAPCWLRTTPVLLPPPLPRRRPVQLDRRVEQSVYPCGAIFHDQRWVVSFGAQEEYCCLTEITPELIMAGPIISQKKTSQPAEAI
jgi:predicted GH43/DUF377 family glycosyl hydrolase